MHVKASAASPMPSSVLPRTALKDNVNTDLWPCPPALAGCRQKFKWRWTGRAHRNLAGSRIVRYSCTEFESTHAVWRNGVGAAWRAVRSPSHAPSIRSHRGPWVVCPDFQPRRVPEEPVCIHLFRKSSFYPLHFWNLPFMSYRLCTVYLYTVQCTDPVNWEFPFLRGELLADGNSVCSWWKWDKDILDNLCTPSWYSMYTVRWH
jgi:hypothetical protein